MTWGLRTVAVAVMAAASSAHAQPAAAGGNRPVSLDDIMSIRSPGGIDISPDGRAVAFTVTAWEHPNAVPERGDTARGDVHDRRSHIWLARTGGGEARQLTFGERGESMPRWSPDGRTIAFVAARGSGDGATRSQIWLLRLDGGDPVQLTRGRGGVVGFTWSPDGSRIAFLSPDTMPRAEEARRRRRDDAQLFEGASQLTHLWVVDVASGQATEIAHGEFTQSGGGVNGMPSWSPDGNRIAFAAARSPLLRGLEGAVYIATLSTGRLDRVATINRSPATGLLRPVWSPDGRTLVYVNVPQRETMTGDSVPEPRLGNGHLVFHDIATGRTREIDGSAFDHEIGQPDWTADGRALIFTTSDRVNSTVVRYDVARGDFKHLVRGSQVGGLSVSTGSAMVAYTLETPTEPADVYVSGLDFASPRRLTNLNPRVADWALGETEVVSWRSADGLPVEGILLKPVGYRPGTRYPLLVEVHGGPTSAFTNGFKATTSSPGQFWAGRGWATFYPNPRGSTGYGEAFMRANVDDWGGGDFQDIMTGVDSLIARGIVDSTRMAINGWSYGGYMTAWAVTQTSRFRAARMGAGMSDILSMYLTSEIPGYIGLFHGGMPREENLDVYRAHSPITFAERVTTPLLILHGAADVRVPTGQAIEFYRALRDRGRPVELVFYPRAGHGLSEYYHLLDRMRRDHDWITRYTLEAHGERASGDAP